MRNFLIALSFAGTIAMPGLAFAGTTGVNYGSCVDLQNDMSLGSRDGYTNGEVTILQQFLGSTYTTPGGPAYLTVQSTGFYGTQTEAAIAKFQTDQQLDSVGNLGPLTRARIKQLTCGSVPAPFTISAAPASGTAPLPVTFTFTANQAQTSYAVDFGDGNTSTSVTPCPQAGTCSGGVANVSHTYSSAGTFSAHLVDSNNTILASTTIAVSQNAATAATATLTFNGSTNAQNADPLASGTWSWTSANADIVTATAVITGCADSAKNAVINPWLPWAVANASGTSLSGSIAEVPGAARSGCTINATYSVTNSTTGAHTNATAVVQFKMLLPGDIPPNPGTAQCVDLQNDMTLNSTDSGSNGEVSKLQAFLQSTKSAAGSAYLTGEPTGYFGQLTSAAVIQFQTDNNLLAAGFVGPITRAKIKTLTCTGINAPTITVTSPNGGEQLQEGDTNTVTWAPYNYNPDINPSSDVSAYLEAKDSSGNFVSYGQVQESGKASIHWITGELNSASQGGNFAPAGGGYYIRVVNSVTGAWDRSDAPFTLLQRPIILKVNGSESWVSIADVNEPITLSWTTVSGVSNCQLSGMKNIPSSTIQPNNGSVSGLISYDSVQGGISYGVSLQCAQTVNGASTPVTAYAKFFVASVPQIPITLTVTNPNGGEQVQLGQPYTIHLAQSGLTTFSVALYRNDQWAEWLTKDAAPADTIQWTPTAAEIASGDMGQNIFKIYVTGQRADGQGYIDDKSDAPFAVVSGTTPPDNPSCTDLQNDMDYRSTDAGTNGDVSRLQFFLQSATTPFGAPYLTVEPTGYYGQLTRAAVVQFQTDNGLPMAGSVGPQTRAKIKALTCGGTSQGFSASPTSGPAPLAVMFTFPSSYGDILIGGTSYKIDFGDNSSPQPIICNQTGQFTCGAPITINHTYTVAGSYTATLKSQNASLPPPYGSVVTVVGTQTITVTQGTTPPPNAECTVLTSDLSVGSTDATANGNGEVTRLQQFLVAATSPSTGSAYLTVDVTDYGWFGKLTEKAVKQFQTDNGISNTGVVGPITRAKIKDISCGGGTPPAGAPTVALTASPDALTCADSACSNARAAIGWNVKNATMCVATGGAGWDGYAPNGSWQNTLASGGGSSIGDTNVSPTATSTYQLACTNNASNVPVSGTATITVSPAPTMCNVAQEWQSCANGAYAARIGPNCSWAACPYNPNPATAPDVSSFSADATAVSYGNSTTLHWNVTPLSTTACTLATNGGSGQSVSAKSDMPTGSITAATTYTLSCKTNGGPSASKDVKITIDTRAVPTILLLTQYPSLTGPGGFFTLSWDSTNADACKLDYSSDNGQSFKVLKANAGTKGSDVSQMDPGVNGSTGSPFNVDGTFLIRLICTGNGTAAATLTHYVESSSSSQDQGGD